MKFFGPPFTWCNMQHGLLRRWELQDHGLCNLQWLEEFFRAAIVHLARVACDHCPLLQINNINNNGPHPFHFEKFWIKIESFFFQIIEQG